MQTHPVTSCQNHSFILLFMMPICSSNESLIYLFAYLLGKKRKKIVNQMETMLHGVEFRYELLNKFSVT